MSVISKLATVSLSRRDCLALAAVLPSAGWSADLTTDKEWDVWQRSRAQWLVGPRLAYFDNATFTPANRAVLAAQYRAMEAWYSDPTGFYARNASGAATQAVLSRMGEWLNAGIDELCIAPADGSGLAQAADELVLAAGDDIVVARQLPEAVQRSWKELAARRGCSLVTVDLPMPLLNPQQVVDAFTQVLTDRTRVLCFSHVQPGDGSILPATELCALARARGITSVVEGSLALARARGITSVVEGSLAVAALPLSLNNLGCDIYLGSLCHWLHGPSPLGFIYVRSAVQAQLQRRPFSSALPADINTSSWPLLQQRWPHDFVRLAVHCQALPAALQWVDALGASAIENRLRRLQTYARISLQNLNGAQLLTSAYPTMQLHVLALRLKNPPARRVADWLQRNDNVIVGALDADANLGAVLRLAFDVDNSLDDIDRLLLGLQRALNA